MLGWRCLPRRYGVQLFLVLEAADAEWLLLVDRLLGCCLPSWLAFITPSSPNINRVYMLSFGLRWLWSWKHIASGKIRRTTELRVLLV